MLGLQSRIGPPSPDVGDVDWLASEARQSNRAPEHLPSAFAIGTINGFQKKSPSNLSKSAIKG
jgi:hypothetical protein